MTVTASPHAFVDEIESLARPLRTSVDLTPLLERMSDARFVLLGEASLDFVAVEGDWPDGTRSRRRTRGTSSERVGDIAERCR